MNILITRPKHFAESLAKKIKALGATPFVFPTLHIIPTPNSPSFDAQLKTLEKETILIFTSRFAAYYGIQALKRVFDPLPTWTMATIGPGTEKELKNFGLTSIHCPAPPYESESLLNLSFLNNIKNKSIALFRGNEGRPLLSDTLLQRGAALSLFEVYQRKLPHKNQVPKLNPNNPLFPQVVICCSASALKNLKLLVNKPTWETLIKQTFVLVGLRMDEFAANLGIGKRILASDASDEALLTALATLEDSVK